MPPSASQDTGYTWLFFALLTVVSWGVYGVFLHTGQLGMKDPENGRYKAFLFVGIAYFLVAVLAPLLLLILKGASWKYPVTGMVWSLVAGIVGAIGAFGVLLAFGAGGPKVVPVVMSIIFAGAPVVNALVSLSQHPPEGGWSRIPVPFWLGILMAAAGGCLVMYFKPPPAKPHAKPAPVAAVEHASPMR